MWPSPTLDQCFDVLKGNDTVGVLQRKFALIWLVCVLVEGWGLTTFLQVLFNPNDC